MAAANKPHRPTNVKSIDNLFNKYEDMLVTCETAVNFRIRKRHGIVQGEGLFVVQSHGFVKKILSLFSRRKPKFFEKSLKVAINELLLSLKPLLFVKG